MAAAQALDSRYCLLAHGAVLTRSGVSVDQLRAILTDFHDAGLELAEVGIIEILDVALTATMRRFASKTFSALGAGPDAAFDELEGQLSDLLPA